MGARCLVVLALILPIGACLSAPQRVIDTREVLRVEASSNESEHWRLEQGPRSLSERQFFSIAGDQVSVARIQHAQERARFLQATGISMIGSALIFGVVSLLANETLPRFFYGGAGLALSGTGTFLIAKNSKVFEPKHRSIEREIAERAARSYNARHQLSLRTEF